MSYDVYLKDPVTSEVIKFNSPHGIRGGNYAIGGNTAWLNITYNYSEILYRVLNVDGVNGLRSLYGTTGRKAIPILEKAIAELKDNVDPDYWKDTEGNVKEALRGLLTFARMRPDGVFDGD